MVVSPALRVALLYAAIASAWILAGEWILDTVIPGTDEDLVEMLRNLGFVGVTAVGIYLMLGRRITEIARGASRQHRLSEQLEERTTQQQLLARRLMKAEEETRRAVAKDLHDGPLQALTLSFMRLDALSRQAEDAAAEPINAAAIGDAMAAIRGASNEIREVVRALHPPLLAELGLAAALERHCREVGERSERTVDFALEGDAATPINPDAAIAVFRIAQEAIYNGVKHTSAGSIRVSLALTPGRIDLRVEDEGPGFNPEMGVGIGLGLLSMRERAESTGGTVQVESSAGAGTGVHARIPLEGASTPA